LDQFIEFWLQKGSGLVVVRNPLMQSETKKMKAANHDTLPVGSHESKKRGKREGTDGEGVTCSKERVQGEREN